MSLERSEKKQKTDNEQKNDESELGNTQVDSTQKAVIPKKILATFRKEKPLTKWFCQFEKCFCEWNLIFYHSQCADGVAALWTFFYHYIFLDWRVDTMEKYKTKRSSTSKCEGHQLYPLQAGKTPTEKSHELFQDKSVLMLDVSFSREQTMEYSTFWKNCLVIDHHKSALRALVPENMRDKLTSNGKQSSSVDDEDVKSLGPVDKLQFAPNTNTVIKIDTRRSACCLAWEYFSSTEYPTKTLLPNQFDCDRCRIVQDKEHLSISPESTNMCDSCLMEPPQERERGDKTIPLLLHYVEDRDLWKFEMPNSEAVNEHMYRINILNETDMVRLTRHVCSFDMTKATEYAKSAQPRLIVLNDMIAKVVKTATIRALTVDRTDQRYKVKLVQAPPLDLLSKTGHMLTRDKDSCDFAVMWYFDAKDNRFGFSLRSNEDRHDIDLSKITAEFGGGGHAQAAGFSIPNISIPEKKTSTMLSQVVYNDRQALRDANPIDKLFPLWETVESREVDKAC